ncbi:MAG TPA: serine/threonine-protein kinase, partial [Polyangiales bacterium]|nr:serine/threonine-protein kinase [Polyangiales bacterium]
MIDVLAQTLSPAMPRLRAGTQLQGGRLHVLETLGHGGMGVVYRAFDRDQRAQVALKTMHRVEPSAIYALKNEFRALTDVRHPNLVRLLDLFSEADGWFFTMELIDGVRFDQWVRPNGLDEPRLRNAFAQLIDAIDCVHAAGKLHRDIKPSNVVVSADGHVCVLDFGLVTEPHAKGVGQTVSDHFVVGTPAYLAPEQGLGERASVASDVYALGVMLFEALMGKLPFAGSATEMLMAKQHGVPAWPEDFEPGAQLGLVEICSRLLSRDPAARPSCEELRSEFARPHARGSGRASFSSLPPPMAAALIGRESELEQLRDAYRTMLSGRAVLVSVSGDSGIGKSALCQAFLDELQREGHAVVLRGRCNERESVPYKSFDALVDDLSRHLRRLRPEQTAALLPRDAAELLRLFPVLGRVDALAEAPVRAIADPNEQQRRAFEAFLELLGRMRDRAPLVLHIDDLQWTDRDSSQLL